MSFWTGLIPVLKPHALNDKWGFWHANELKGDGSRGVSARLTTRPVAGLVFFNLNDERGLLLLNEPLMCSPRDYTPHTSRTIMLEEVSVLLAATAPTATGQDYERAVIEENVLLKATPSSRRKTLRYLRQLYGLEPADSLFAAFRFFWYQEASARPQLALLQALFHDVILRTTAPYLLSVLPGKEVAYPALSATIEQKYPGKYTQSTLRSSGQNCASSWTQSGHLRSAVPKIRVKPTLSAGAASFALFLADMTGVAGKPMFDTLWVRALDASRAEIEDVVFFAQQRGWLRYKHLGSVVEVTFKDLLNHLRG